MGQIDRLWAKAAAMTALAMVSNSIAGMATPVLADPVRADAAHTLAQKFAEQGEQAKPASPPAPASKPIETRTSAGTPTQKTPERPTLEYEMDLLRQARAEAAERRNAERPATLLLAPAGAPVGPLTPAVQSSAIEATKQNLPSPATSAAQQERAPRLADVKPAAAPIAQPPPLVQPSTAAQAPVVATERVTILLVIDNAAPGLERLMSSHDPLICVGDTCHVSSGFQTAAKALPHAEATSLQTSEGVTPDTCRAKTACIYRDVAVPATPRITLLDLGSDRKAAKSGDGYTADIDKSCRVLDGELTCDHGLATPDFRLWVVPEATAKSAGAKVLEEALVDGLGGMSVNGSNDK